MTRRVEASELVEIFQWMSESESDALDKSVKARAAKEIADIQTYTLQVAARLDIDIEDTVAAKL